VPSKRRYVKLPATQRTATQQQNNQPTHYNSPRLYHKPFLLVRDCTSNTM